jgi:hypothetical protein
MKRHRPTRHFTYRNTRYRWISDRGLQVETGNQWGKSNYVLREFIKLEGVREYEPTAI